MPDRKGNVDQPFSGWYKNYEGKVQWRTILPIELWYGSTDWHPAEQWFIKAYDPTKDAQRDFALADFLGDIMAVPIGATLDEEFKAIVAHAANLGYQLISDEQAAMLEASLTVGNGLVVHGTMEALARVQQYILLPSRHPVEDSDVKRQLARDLQATEALLEAANKRIAELSAMLIERG